MDQESLYSFSLDRPSPITFQDFLKSKPTQPNMITKYQQNQPCQQQQLIKNTIPIFSMNQYIYCSLQTNLMIKLEGNDDYSYGSGSFIIINGYQCILTAAHNIVKISQIYDKIQQQNAQEITIYRGKHNKLYYDEKYEGRDAIYYPQYHSKFQISDGCDIAIIFLRQYQFQQNLNFNEKNIIFGKSIDELKVSKEASIVLIGYPFECKDQLIQMEGKISEIKHFNEMTILEYDLPATPGCSGAPIYYVQQGENAQLFYYLIGIHVGEFGKIKYGTEWIKEVCEIQKNKQDEKKQQQFSKENILKTQRINIANISKQIEVSNDLKVLQLDFKQIPIDNNGLVSLGNALKSQMKTLETLSLNIK